MCEQHGCPQRPGHRLATGDLRVSEARGPVRHPGRPSQVARLVELVVDHPRRRAPGPGDVADCLADPPRDASDDGRRARPPREDSRLRCAHERRTRAPEPDDGNERGAREIKPESVHATTAPASPLPAAGHRDIARGATPMVVRR